MEQNILEKLRVNYYLFYRKGGQSGVQRGELRGQEYQEYESQVSEQEQQRKPNDLQRQFSAELNSERSTHSGQSEQSELE